LKLRFLGANRQVTGSSYLLEVDNLSLIIDCGLFQERDYLARNWERFLYDPRKIDAVILTHGHLDHCGLIPKLCNEGFSGPIFATEPSVELAAIVMLDSGHIHEEDAKYKRKRHAKEGRTGPHPVVPLYTQEDAERAAKQLKPVVYNKPLKFNDAVSVTWHDAGHILGSSMLSIDVTESGQTRRIVFSGDIGQRDKPLIKDPTMLKQADIAVIESTYGDRLHDHDEDIESQLARVINDTIERGGNVIVPTFAIERAQELLWHFGRLLAEKKTPRLPIFLDSPMAVNVTEVFKRYGDYMDAEAKQVIAGGHDPLEFAGVEFSRTTKQSKAINTIRGSAIIMAGSGMCTGGRIKHHLANNIEHERNTILFVGYQSIGTLGRLIVDGKNPVRIHGVFRDVKAKIEQMHGMSAHADQRGLLEWIQSFNPKPKHVFITHGDPGAAKTLEREIRERGFEHVVVPQYGQKEEL